MDRIKSLFDQSKDIYRRIEKVINFDAQERLKDEVREYVVTDHIEQKVNDLLRVLDDGMQNGRSEVGVWVSGFYGSGKSSLTKYIGLALDSRTGADHNQIDGRPFRDHLADRFQTKATAAQLRTVAQKRDPAVVMLDLASEQRAGATMAEVSTVLYAKVMHWAGYAQDLKLIQLEQMLEREGKLDAFNERVRATTGTNWDEFKDELMMSVPVASQIAHELYPEVYPTPDTLASLQIQETTLENQRVRDMVETVRRRSGRENVVFVLDEVGQYVAASDDKILNLQGLAENLKNLYGGAVWIVATAQQTLTEDDPRARLNSAKLFKLKDRFPVGIDLEARDIREIAYKRLLEKSADGRAALGALYEEHHAMLRYNTELQGTKLYADKLDQKQFVDLYPFLPQHFTILLELLTKLSRSTGGLGLRSAIKVIQDVLIAKSGRAEPLAEAEVGTLATVATFFDALRADLARPKSFSHVVDGVDRAATIFGADSVEVEVAKAVAVLQVLDNLPATRANLAALLHPSAHALSRLEEVEGAVKNLLDEEDVPVSEVEETLRFMSEAVAELESERRDIIVTPPERSRIEAERLRALFSPQPSAKLQNRTVRAGLQLASDGRVTALEGERDEVQIVLELVPANRYDAVRQSRAEDSARPEHRDRLYLVGREDPELRTVLDEVHRSREVFRRHRNDGLDRETKEYVDAQQGRAAALVRDEVDRRLRDAFRGGSLVFRGQPQAVSALDPDLGAAVQKGLAAAASQIYDKYAQAPVNARATVAERFLRTDALNKIDPEADPLSLVASDGTIDSAHPALQSVLDHLAKRGSVEGQRLMEDFAAAPYGWSKDTLRYLVAALLVAGEITLRVAGDDITVRGDTAIEALKGTSGFRRTGVALRDAKIDLETKLRASERLLALTGDDPLPSEDQIAQTVQKHFPDLQKAYAGLASELNRLGLPGATRARALFDDLTAVLRGDASQAAAQLGAPESTLADDLAWARKVAHALDNGAADPVQRAARYVEAVPTLPTTGALGELGPATADALDRAQAVLARDDFYDALPDLRAAVSDVEAAVEATRQALDDEQVTFLTEQRGRIEGRPEWGRLGSDDQIRLGAFIDGLQAPVGSGLDGVRQHVYKKYEIGEQLRLVREEVERLADQQPPPEPPPQDRKGETETVETGEIASTDQLDALIARLQGLRAAVASGARIVFRS